MRSSTSWPKGCESDTSIITLPAKFRAIRCSQRTWIPVPTYARALAEAAGFSLAATDKMKHLGTALNYNAYGETLDDLHVPPAALAQEMLGYLDPLDFAARSAAFR